MTSSSSSKRLFPEPWVQEVANRASLPPQSPAVVRSISGAVDTQLRILIQQAIAFQRKGKSKKLKVEHVNLSLKKHRLEPVYGLHGKVTEREEEEGECKNLEELAKQFAAPAVPLKPVLGLHWLAVNGTQPAVPENPVVLSDKAQQELKTLPKEFQNLYVRIVGALLQATDNATQRAVLRILAEDQCLQPLVPLLARFFYTQVKAHSRSQPVQHLMRLLEALNALQSNAQVSLEAHLAQLLSGVFTLVAAPQLGNDTFVNVTNSSSNSSSVGLEVETDSHWTLRKQAAELVASFVRRYHTNFPDLLERVCRTYLDALQASTHSLATAYGGIVGIAALGNDTVRQLLLPQLPYLKRLLDSAAVAETLPLQHMHDSEGGLDQPVEDNMDQDSRMDVDQVEQGDQIAVGKKRSRPQTNPVTQTSQVSRHQLWQNQQEALQCRAALVSCLGKLPRLRRPMRASVVSTNHNTTTNDGATEEWCDLEELLAVFVAARSPHTVSHAFLSL